MPVRRKYRRYKKRAYRPQYKSKAFTNAVSRVVRSNVSEKKLVTLNFAPTPGTSGNVNVCVKVSQGDTNLTRAGDSISITGIKLTGTLKNNASGTNGTRVFCALVLDKQQVSDTAPDFTDVFSTPVESCRLRHAHYGRFKILWSKTYTINPQYAAQVINVPIKIWKSFKKYPLPVRFNGSSDTDYQKNGIYFLTLSDQAAYPPALDIFSTVFFTDP